MSIAIAVITFGLLIFVHELGHFLAARFFKVGVETFSIGFGPKICSWQKNGTVYAISLIPFGGYVKMRGETPDEIAAKNDTPTSLIDDGDFFSKKWHQRATIALAGPVFNLVFGFILIVGSFMIGKTYSDLSPIIASAEHTFQAQDRILDVNGVEIQTFSDIFTQIVEKSENIFTIERDDVKVVETIYIDSTAVFYRSVIPQTSNIVGEVTPGMPAWKAGIMVGDRILSIDETETHTWWDIRRCIANSQNETIVMKIKRNDEIIDISLTPEINPIVSTHNKMIGITQHLDLTFTERAGVWKAIKLGTAYTISFIYMNHYSLYMLANSPESLKSNIAGPAMIMYLTSQTTKRGLSDFMLFVATISIVLMVMNLLPIPILDGGQIIFCVIEGIFRKPIPPKIQTILQMIGIALLLTLMIYAFYSDIRGFWSRWSR